MFKGENWFWSLRIHLLDPPVWWFNELFMNDKSRDLHVKDICWLRRTHCSPGKSCINCALAGITTLYRWSLDLCAHFTSQRHVWRSYHEARPPWWVQAAVSCLNYVFLATSPVQFDLQVAGCSFSVRGMCPLPVIILRLFINCSAVTGFHNLDLLMWFDQVADCPKKNRISHLIVGNRGSPAQSPVLFAQATTSKCSCFTWNRLWITYQGNLSASLSRDEFG